MESVVKVIYLRGYGGFSLSDSQQRYATTELWRRLKLFIAPESQIEIEVLGFAYTKPINEYKFADLEYFWADVLAGESEKEKVRLPVFFSSNDCGPVIVGKKNRVSVRADILGMYFYFLAQIGEFNLTNYDDDGNCVEAELLTFRDEFAMSPFLDEWARAIGSWLVFRGVRAAGLPSLKSRTRVTVDVDHLCYHGSIRRIASALYSDTCLRAVPVRRALGRVYKEIGSRLSRSDPLIESLVYFYETSISNHIKPLFYFMAAAPTAKNSGYDIASIKGWSPRLSKLIDWLADDEIGWHVGYHTGDQLELMRSELECLSARLGRRVRMTRFHYLRFRPQSSPAYLNAVQVEADSSVGFNYRPGFRAGTSVAFNAFNIKADEVEPLRLQPFFIMDSYEMQIDVNDAVQCALAAIERSRGHAWICLHNTRYATYEYPSVTLTAVLEGIAKLDHR